MLKLSRSEVRMLCERFRTLPKASPDSLPSTNVSPAHSKSLQIGTQTLDQKYEYEVEVEVEVQLRGTSSTRSLA